jgi:hypothetical protein
MRSAIHETGLAYFLDAAEFSATPRHGGSGRGAALIPWLAQDFAAALRRVKARTRQLRKENV